MKHISEYCVALFEVKTGKDYLKMEHEAWGSEFEKHRKVDRGLIALGTIYKRKNGKRYKPERSFYLLYDATFPGTPNQLINAAFDYYKIYER